MQKVRVVNLAFTFISFLDVVAQHPSLSVPTFCPHRPLHHPDLQHPQRPWQGVADTAQAHPLAGVSLIEWVTQPKHRLRAQALQLLQLHGHTPIHLPDSHHDLQCQDDATVISATDPEVLPHSGASSSSRTAASKFLSTFGLPSLWKQMADHVSGRPGFQETGAFSDRESAATICCSQSKGKRERDTNVVQSPKDRKSHAKSWNRMLTWPSDKR